MPSEHLGEGRKEPLVVHPDGNKIGRTRSRKRISSLSLCRRRSCHQIALDRISTRCGMVSMCSPWCGITGAANITRCEEGRLRDVWQVAVSRKAQPKGKDRRAATKSGIGRAWERQCLGFRLNREGESGGKQPGSLASGRDRQSASRFHCMSGGVGGAAGATLRPRPDPYWGREREILRASRNEPMPKPAMTRMKTSDRMTLKSPSPVCSY